MKHSPFQPSARRGKCSKPLRLRLSCLAGLAWLLVFASVAVARGGPDDAGAKGTAGAAAAPAPEAIEFFESRVRPILADRCFKCHGEKKQSNGLRLDSREAVLKGGDSGPAVVVGKPDESLLVQAVAQTHAEIKMPPSGKLPDSAIATLRQWVVQGAPWPAAGTAARGNLALRTGPDPAAHWAFKSIKPVSPPAVKDRSRVSSPLDAFVVARLEAAGMSPSPPASKRALIRRATIDLWGIPPTAEEVEAFEADNSPDAFERLVDRLLASPRYGERWGRHWLDVARYADTKGYVFTQDRRYPYAYTYRDYVIAAFNADLAYDRFIVAADRRRPAPTEARTGGRSGRDGVPDGRPAVPAGPERDHRRPDRRGLPRVARPDGHLCPLPRPQVRPDPDGRLLLALRRLRQLGRAGRAALAGRSGGKSPVRRIPEETGGGDEDA